MGSHRKKLPIGIENFEDLLKEDFYYVDKTGFIAALLNNWGAVNLFTRPRRFGKSLNMSMLECFFSPDGDKGIFDGLKISGETELCREYMGKYPVISVSLKGIDALDYDAAFRMAVQTVIETAAKFYFLLESEKLNEYDKDQYRGILDKNMTEAVFNSSLKILSGMLEKHYGKKVIVLIDEYDVPLARAFENGYYERMMALMRGMLGQTLKTNHSLRFAVLTGCMRISKESIFTGLNNLKVLTIADERFDEYFGFTDDEVRTLLEYYGREDHYEEVREWYDGYQFGNTDVYCPWDVLNHCDRIRNDPSVRPENYWINTSSNSAVKRFIEESANAATKREIEALAAGETVEKEICQELTYPEMYQTIDHMWSLLFMTGYLTKRGRADGRRFRLAIPNLEIRDIFVTQIMEYFREGVEKDGETLGKFCDALQDGRPEDVERIFAEYLRRTISIRDTSAGKNRKENFYHGILLGILGAKPHWGVSSNRESGEGYADILVEPDNGDQGIVIEVKYAHDGNLEAACREALRQIDRNRYADVLLDEGRERILKYGIACYKKRCRVMAENGL